MFQAVTETGDARSIFLKKRIGLDEAGLGRYYGIYVPGIHREEYRMKHGEREMGKRKRTSSVGAIPEKNVFSHLQA